MAHPDPDSEKKADLDLGKKNRIRNTAGGGGSVPIVRSSPCCVHTVYSLTQRCPLSHTVVAAAQQTLAELVEGDLEQRLSKPLLSWWKESARERESDSATLAEC